MAKRFTDTEKWKKPWFSELPNEAKIVWIYLLDDCDNRGVWTANFRRLSFDVGFEVTEEKLKSWFEGKMTKIESDKFCIPSFINFQYPSDLNEKNNAHKPIINFLQKHPEILGPKEDLKWSSWGPQVKVKDKVKDKVKVKIKVKDKEDGKDFSKRIEAEVYVLYPRKDGKAKGVEKLAKEITNDEMLALLVTAVKKFKEKHERLATPEQFIPLFSTFSSTWRDCLEPDYGTSTIKGEMGKRGHVVTRANLEEIA